MPVVDAVLVAAMIALLALSTATPSHVTNASRVAPTEAPTLARSPQLPILRFFVAWPVSM